MNRCLCNAATPFLLLSVSRASPVWQVSIWPWKRRASSPVSGRSFRPPTSLRIPWDTINQEELVKKLQTYPKLRQIIKRWLKAGVVDNGVFTPTKAGTPQGGLCKALHNPPYAKWKTMQSKCRKGWKLLNFYPIYFA